MFFRTVFLFISTGFDIETCSIREFVRTIARGIKKNSRVLDAGAGTCPYKKYFMHTIYESTDFENIFNRSSKGLHSFLCDLSRIPRKNNSYDVILNTQVLEHVPDPLKVLKEFHRVLKPNGRLFLTAPLNWGVHGDPYHFFHFSKYGLALLFQQAGFKIELIKARGGIFWFTGYMLKKLPEEIISQNLFEKVNNNKVLHIKWKLFFLLPFYILFLPLTAFFIPLLFFFLDVLDKKKNFTLGYQCICVKASASYRKSR